MKFSWLWFWGDECGRGLFAVYPQAGCSFSAPRLVITGQILKRGIDKKAAFGR
jgi:hypothetical protein